MLAHLLHCLCLFAARHTFWFWAKHVPGRLNGAADALSRNQMICFFESSPQEMHIVCTLLTKGLPELLYQHQEIWILPVGTEQFSAILARHYQLPQRSLMHQHRKDISRFAARGISPLSQLPKNCLTDMFPS